MSSESASSAVECASKPAADFHDKENRIDNQNDDENVFVLTAQNAYFFCFGLATDIHMATRLDSI